MSTFERLPIPPDTLYLTPGSEVTAGLQPLPDGGEAIAIGFDDPRAGHIRVLLHPVAAKAVADGINRTLDNAAYLRVENNKIRNEQKGTTHE